MGLTMILFAMIAAWVVAAMAMLWGVLRIARRHYPIAQADIDMSRPSTFAAQRDLDENRLYVTYSLPLF